MSKIQVNRIVNANIYLEGTNMLGRAEEVKLPDITAIMAEHKALGMVGKIELPSGFDKLEGEIKWNSLYEESAAAMANPFKTVQIQCRSSIETYTSGGRVEEVSLVTFLTVMFKKNPLGTFKQHDNAEFSSSFTATYIKQVVKGRKYWNWIIWPTCLKSTAKTCWRPTGKYRWIVRY
jgi:P2 family phage contractile tail tube protein